MPGLSGLGYPGIRLEDQLQMLYRLIYLFHTDLSWLNVFRYITFRTILASLTALLICFIFGGWAIRKLGAIADGGTDSG